MFELEKQKRRKRKSLLGKGARSGKGLRIRFAVCFAAGVLATVLIISALNLNTRKIQTKAIGAELRDVGELSTQVAYITTIAKLEDNARVLGVSLPGTTSKYIFSYDVTVKAGIDFSLISLSVDEAQKTVTIVLPETEIQSAELDADSLTEWDTVKNIFTPLGIDDVNATQSEMRQKAIDSAIEKGILENARGNAENLIRNMLAGTYDEKEYTYIFD